MHASFMHASFAQPTSNTHHAGYLVTFAYREQQRDSEYYVIDAHTMQPVAILPLPGRVPFGFHGAWVSRTEIEALKEAET